MADATHHSPLEAEHHALGARFAPFGGWDMPLQYSSVLEEHRACRTDAVMFDVSHLGSVHVEGPGAHDALQWAFTNDLDRVTPGRAQYTHLLDPADAHVVDDIIVWWIDDDDFLVMPNASNTGGVTTALAEAAGRVTAPSEARDITGTRAVIAVQGPHARAKLAAVAPDAATVARFDVRAVHDAFDGYTAGTGYTGEDGVELHIPAADAPAVWRTLVAAGVQPAGLGARDTLRLEAAYPLHGHELGPGITPLQAGLGWVVRFDKAEFRGRAPLLAEKEHGIARRLRGLLAAGRQIPRAECPVLVDNAPVGEVTSGNFSPTLGRGIALAFLPPDTEIGTPFEIEVRGRRVPTEVVKTPFVPHRA